MSVLKVYEMIVKYSAKLFSKRLYFNNLDFTINKLVIYSDSIGSLIALDIIKHSIKTGLKVPDAGVFLFPNPRVYLSEEILKDSIIMTEDHSLEIPFIEKIQELLLNPNEDMNIKYNEDDRLNFFLTDTNLVSNFPQVFVISPANEPIREDSQKLAHFFQYIKFNLSIFRTNNVNVSFKQLNCYSNGLFQISSLFELQYKITLEYLISYIIDIFRNNLDKKKFDKLNYKPCDDIRKNSVTSVTTTAD